MAQTGYTPILIYSSSTASQAPAAGNLTNSTLGSELAINITDGKLFYKDSGGSVQVIAGKVTPTTAGGTGLTSYTAGDMLYYASGTALSKLAIGTSGQWLGSSGTAPQWNSPAALTKTDDTNVTLTLGGSASTALLNAASLTLGWTGQLSVGRGGTGASTFTAGRLLFGNGASAINTDSNLFWDNTNKRFGVGTSSPSTTVEFSGAPALLRVSGTSGTVPQLQLVSGGVVNWSLRVNQNGGSDFTIYQDSTERFLFASGGDLTFKTGNLIQGTAAKGIDFAANSGAAGVTSKLLNWYEEGTFTPTYTSDGTPPTCTYSIQDAKYTRIGRMVYFSIEIRTTTASGGTGNLGVAGLPFTSKNDRYSGTTNVGFAYAFTTQCPTTGYIPANSTILYLCFKTSATEISNISAGYLTNAAASNYLLISGSYVV